MQRFLVCKSPRICAGAGSQPPCRHPWITRAKPISQTNHTSQRAKPGVSGDVQPKWSEGMATIQRLVTRVQEQLEAHSKLRFSNPTLAKELKGKAQQHLELLMKLAESQQENHIQGAGSNSTSQLQQLLQELEVQLDLEKQVMLTASIGVIEPTHAADAASNAVIGRADSTGSQVSSTGSSGSEAGLQQQLQQSQQEVSDLRGRLSEAEARAVSLQQQLDDADARLQSVSEELHEHRELQMAYDKQCQDLYRLRMQLQLVQSQGSDAASLAAMANKQHKQDLAWLMEAHRKEVKEAHRKSQDLIHEVQQLRLKVLEQEQLLWMGGAAAAQQQQHQQHQQQQEQHEQQEEGPHQQLPQLASEAHRGPDEQQQLQQQAEVQLQMQQLQEATEQLTAEKQQLMRSLQDIQREQAMLLVELQNLRSNAAAAEAAMAAAAATSSREAEAAALAEAVAAAEATLKVQLQETEQQRDSLVGQVQDLQVSLQEATAAAAAAQAANSAQRPLVAAAAASADQAVGRLDAAAAVEQLKVAKVEMASLRVQLADARRELRAASGRAASAEVALQQQAAAFEARLAKLQAWYNKQAAVVAQLRRGKAPKDGQVGFTNTNRFWVPQELLYEFLKHWVSREAQLQQQEGFLGLQVQPGVALTPDDGVDVVVSSLWESIPAWEEWSKSTAGTQQHMPSGVLQYVPAKGEGFPEAFVPFRDYDEAVNAKY